MEIDFFGKSQRGPVVKREMISADDRLKKMTVNYQNFGYDYFDNPEIGVGYGGYKYNGRYYRIAEKIIKYYELPKSAKVLELGCAKGFLLIEFKKLGLDVYGIDFSEYAVENSHQGVKNNIIHRDVTKGLPYEDDFFDLIISKELLPHIPMNKIEVVLREIIRCSKNNEIFLEIQTGSNKKGLEKMKKWDITHKIFWTPDEWNNFFRKVGYSGDYHFKVLIR